VTRLTLRGGRVVDPSQELDQVTDLHIADGRVLALGPAPDGFQADQVLDCAGLVVCPGLVDLRARLREPGQLHKADIASEVRAAVAGGVTTLVVPPDSDPVVDTSAVVELVTSRARAQGKARVHLIGALTKGLAGEEISEMEALREAGCIGVGNALAPVRNHLVLRRALEYAAGLDLTVFLHPEDPWLAEAGVAHEGAVSLRLGLAGVPVMAETIALARDLALVEQSGARAHFCGLSSHRGVRLLARARFDGLPVTADVTAHHLHLTEMELLGFNVQAHVRPPLRTQRDRDGLRQALVAGEIDAVCSDHQPHDLDAKLGPFAETEPGISALETLLPLTLRLVEEGVLDLSAAIAALSLRPARILGLPVGSLAPGRPADVCCFDPEARWTLHPEALVSRGKNTPFAGWEFQGRVRYTLVDGRLVHRDTTETPT